MGRILIQENGKIRDYADVELAEQIIEKRNKKGPWEVIDDLVKVWSERSPENVKAIGINVDQYRETQKDKKYAQTKLGQDQERRFLLSFPYDLMMMIRSQYKAQELPFDKQFFRDFAKRYPAFRVPEKL